MGFWELLVILIVALVVVGPERMPEAVRSGLLWFGRIKRTINDTKTEFEQQLGVDEIRRELHNEQVLKSLKALEQAQQSTQEQAESIDESLRAEIKKIEDSIDEPVPHEADPNSSESDTQEPDKNKDLPH